MPICSSGRSSDCVRQLGRREVEVSVADGEQPTQCLLFGGVESFRTTYHHSCTREMVDAYDRVVELPQTTWLEEVRQQLVGVGDSAEGLRHLRIYLDDGPCYEFICRSFRVETGEHDTKAV